MSDYNLLDGIYAIQVRKVKELEDENIRLQESNIDLIAREAQAAHQARVVGQALDDALQIVRLARCGHEDQVIYGFDRQAKGNRRRPASRMDTAGMFYQVLMSGDLRRPLQPDTLIEWDGRKVWLKESFVGKKRVGVCGCCDETAPCDWHRARAGRNDARSARISPAG